MARRRRITKKIYVADFETTTARTSETHTRVWGWRWVEVDNLKNHNHGETLEDFMMWALAREKAIYFHNLKFDGKFIISYILRKLKYEFVHQEDEMEKEGQFQTIISVMNQFYQISICVGVRNGQPMTVDIYDSLKKLPFSVKQIGEGWGFNVLKGDIDYHKLRPIGHQMDEEELDYITNDTDIVALALKSRFEEEHFAMTVGSDAFSWFKDHLGTKNYQRLFPVLDDSLDEEIRLAYKGGFTWVNPEFQGKQLKEGLVFDVNSLYPSVMYDRLLPVGEPLPFLGEYEYDKNFPLYISIIECDFELKEGCIPCIQIKNDLRFQSTEYLTSSKKQGVMLRVTSVDWQMILDHYNVTIHEYWGGLKFRGRKDIFKDYVDTFMEQKIMSKGAKKQGAKLMLNSLYGKFATNPRTTPKIPVLQEDGIVKYELPKNEDGSYKEYRKDSVYTAMGCFITAYAREVTIRTGQHIIHRLAYCDTDSIHMVGTEIPKEIEHIIDPDQLGHWNHESTFTRAKFIRAKTYLETEKWKPIKTVGINFTEKENQKKYPHYGYLRLQREYKGKEVKLACPRPNVKCAGMTDKIKQHVSWNNFRIGFKSKGKLLPVDVVGGVILVDTEFTIK